VANKGCGLASAVMKFFLAAVLVLAWGARQASALLPSLGSRALASRSTRGALRPLRASVGTEENELERKLSAGDYSGAYSTLKRNPMLVLTAEDARSLLNNLSQLLTEEESSSVDSEQYQKKLIEASSYVYKRCERQAVFRGFGSVEPDAYPLSSMNEVSPARLEELTGLSMLSLTPRRRGLYWQLAGVGMCAAEYALGTAVGVDPLLTFIPGTLALLAADQLLYRGAYFETVYQTLFPEYKEKIIYHEAGHFLLAYLMGVPVRGVVTSAVEAMKNPEIKGSAGTVFFDTKLAEEIDSQKVTRTSIDRLSIVIMAGIAAEALKYGRAEGGVSDEQALSGFLTTIQPPWGIGRIQGQARWAVSQAICLLREHQDAYNALAETLKKDKDKGGGLGDAVLALEAALPASLPTRARVEEKEAKRRRRTADALLRFVQRRTYQAGGIFPSVPASASASASAATSGAEAGAGAGTEGSDAAATGASTRTQVLVDGPDGSLQAFAEKIKLLETAVARNDLDVSKLTSGGVWLNDLRSLANPPEAPLQGNEVPSAQEEDSGEGSSGSSSSSTRPDIDLPPPLPGYEEAVAKLSEQQANENPFAFAALSSGVAAAPSDPQSSPPSPPTSSLPDSQSSEQLLRSHRGFQLKELELDLVEAAEKRRAKAARLDAAKAEA